MQSFTANPSQSLSIPQKIMLSSSSLDPPAIKSSLDKLLKESIFFSFVTRERQLLEFFRTLSQTHCLVITDLLIFLPARCFKRCGGSHRRFHEMPIASSPKFLSSAHESYDHRIIISKKTALQASDEQTLSRRIRAKRVATGDYPKNVL